MKTTGLRTNRWGGGGGRWTQTAVLILACLTAGSVGGERVTRAWVQRYDGPVGGQDQAVGAAVDGEGNVYVTGYSVGPAGYIDYAVIGYSSRGAPLWTNRYDGPAHGYDHPYGIALDRSNGHVYVTGISDGLWAEECATVAYSTTGIPLWTNRYSAPSDCCPGGICIAVGTGGNVYVGGGTGGMDGDLLALAYSSEGKPLWTNRYGGYLGGFFEAITADTNSGNVYVTGWADAGPPLRIDYVTIAYSASGVPLWTNQYGTTNGGSAWAVVVGAESNVFVTGGANSGLSTHTDYATLAYSAGGVPLWTNRYNGAGSRDDSGSGIVVDHSGKVYVTGGAVNADGRFDCATVAYSADGAPLWTNLLSGASDVSGYGVAVDSQDRIIVVGKERVNATNFDYVTLAYANSGALLWVERYNGPANGYDAPEGPGCLAVGPDDSIYVAGTSEGVGRRPSGYDFLAMKYVHAPDIVLGGVERLPRAAFRFTITAPSNTAYRLEASPDLTNWQTLTNFPPLPLQSVDYTEELAPGFIQRFYRAVWSP